MPSSVGRVDGSATARGIKTRIQGKREFTPALILFEPPGGHPEGVIDLAQPPPAGEALPGCIPNEVTCSRTGHCSSRRTGAYLVG